MPIDRNETVPVEVRQRTDFGEFEVFLPDIGAYSSVVSIGLMIRKTLDTRMKTRSCGTD